MSSAKRVSEKRVEIIPNRLYWISDNFPPTGFSDSFYFSIDKDLLYVPYHHDFGPLHIGNVYKFVVEVDRLLNSKTSSSTALYHWTGVEPDKRSNSVLLMCAFQMLVLGRTAEEAFDRFKKVKLTLDDYCDASYKPHPYRCSILDCLRGLEYATALGWFSLKSFNLKEYTHYEDVDHGDLNWVVPNKFLAFSTPNDGPHRSSRKPFTAEEIVPVLKKFKVGLVVRLNDPLYDRSKLTRAGIDHRDIFFEDGSCPTLAQIKAFISEAELATGAVAVHCKAGLGRTGTMIGMYLMKHFQVPAPALIGWMRLARPGMVLGPQQYFLCKLQDQMFREGQDSLDLKLPEKLLQKMARVAKDTQLRFERCKSPINYYKKEEQQGDRLLRMKDEHQHARPVVAKQRPATRSPITVRR
jgi:cell division cycle 14